MKAYVIAIEAVHDEAMFADYRKKVPDTARAVRRSVYRSQWQVDAA
jgi:uncharacterized protein (DUF1330 family)